MEILIDDVRPGLCLGVVVRIRVLGGFLLRLGDLGPQTDQLVVERLLVDQECSELLVALSERRLQFLELRSGLRSNCGRRYRGIRVVGEPWCGLRSTCVGVGEPVAHMEQLTNRRN